MASTSPPSPAGSGKGRRVAVIVALLLAIVGVAAAVVVGISNGDDEEVATEHDEQTTDPTVKSRDRLPIPTHPLTDRTVVPPGEATGSIDDPSSPAPRDPRDGQETKAVEPGEVVTDATGSFGFQVPDGWTEAGRQSFGGGEFSMVAVSADIDAFLADVFSEPGFAVMIAPREADGLDQELSSTAVACDSTSSPSDYRDDDFEGRTMTFSDCPNDFHGQAVVIHLPDGRSTLVMAAALAPGDVAADYAALFESVEPQ